MKKTLKKALSAMISCALAVPCTGILSAYADMTPNPVISRNCPAYSEANPATASAANDEHYFSFWFGTTPDYLAYDLSAVPEEQRKQIMAVWYNTSSYDVIGNYVSRNMEPSDYTIEVNAAEGGAYPTDGWVVVDTVTDNTLSSRQHLVDMKGYNWIRMNISKADGSAGKQTSINFDIHNVSDGVTDSWLFLGDSITAGGMNNCYGTGFATYVNQLDARYFPIQENGGIGGITSKDGKNNIDRWLSTYPGKFVSIAYGTNDAWGNQTGAQNYYDNTKYMIDAIITAGKTPVLPKIPYAAESGVNTYLDDYNAMVDKLYEEYGDKLIKGPDFDKFFRENPDGLSGDGVHPSSEGYDSMRKLWAETMYANVYSADIENPTSSCTPLTMYGDANCDDEINMADAVIIMQSLANPDKYVLSDIGAANADVSGNNDGVTNKDALAIQKYKLGLINELPETQE
ncbi:MAG: lysophospholipase [Ruminococcus sp.]|nr:lysophospholipase [Ruminococcus sp.]